MEVCHLYVLFSVNFNEHNIIEIIFYKFSLSLSFSRSFTQKRRYIVGTSLDNIMLSRYILYSNCITSQSSFITAILFCIHFLKISFCECCRWGQNRNQIMYWLHWFSNV